MNKQNINDHHHHHHHPHHNHNHVNNNQQQLESSPVPKRQPIIVRATHEYIPVNNDELHITPNDLITITNPEEGGWWEGTLHSNTGWFPSNYVTVIDTPPPLISPELISNDNQQQQHDAAVSITTNQQSEEYKRMIINELIQSEEAFISEMEEFYEGVLVNGPVFGPTPDSTQIKTLLTQSYSQIITTHKSQILTPLKSPHQTTGKIFLHAAPSIQSCYKSYCSLHPKFVQFVERNRAQFESDQTATSSLNPVLRVIMCLSSPFRRIERYGNILNELDCHLEGYHEDKGDLRRGVGYYRELEKSLTTLRKQKEMELEVLTPGTIKDFEGSDISTLGDIILMNLLYISGRTTTSESSQQPNQPRYFVLFPSTILILAYDTNDNSFTYKGRVLVGGITVVNGGSDVGDVDDGEIAFEIAGPTLHPIKILCPSQRIKQTWLHHLNDAIRSTATTRCYSTSSPVNTTPISNGGIQNQQHHAHHHQNNNLQLLPPPHNNNLSRQQELNSSSNTLAGGSNTSSSYWNITRLRPTAPYNPFLAEYNMRGSGTVSKGLVERGGFGRLSGRSISSSGNKSRGSLSGVVSNVSNEEDFMVLSIVDGFCGSGGGGGRVKGDGAGGSSVLMRNDPSNRSIRSLDHYQMSSNSTAHNISVGNLHKPLLAKQQFHPGIVAKPHSTNQPLLPNSNTQLLQLLHEDITSLHKRIDSLTKQLDEEKMARSELFDAFGVGKKRMNDAGGGEQIMK